MKTKIIMTALFLTGSIVLAQETKHIDEVKGLKAGDMAPDFTTIDADSISFNLYKTLKSGPVVLIFYRGFWCPYCNKHLSSIQDSLKMITDKGAYVVAASPENPLYLTKMRNNTGAKFRLLYDKGYNISDAYNLTYTPETKQLLKYKLINAQLKESHSDDSQRLPIPATYIIGTNGKIIWRQFNPDYRKRSIIKDILMNLP